MFTAKFVNIRRITYGYGQHDVTCTVQVFKEKAASRDDAGQAARAAYGDASGKLFEDRDRRRGEESLKGRNEEVRVWWRALVCVCGGVC